MKLALGLFFTLVCIAFPTLSVAQNGPEIRPLTNVDIEFMSAQRQRIEDIAARYLGRSFSGSKIRDIDLLEALLEKQLVRSAQKRELQAMGVILGDLLATDLGMHWVIYEDKQGRSRALRYKVSDNYLFPITMISRRREAGNTTPVSAIYKKAYDAIDSSRVPLPFQ